MADSFINRYNSFCKSLAGLKEAKHRDPSDDFVLSGTIQKYNLTFDISWKVMKDIIVKYHGILDFATGSPREVLRKAYMLGLIEADTWMDMLNDRNELAHDYDGTLATSCFDIIICQYIDEFEKFKNKAEPILRQMENEKEL